MEQSGTVNEMTLCEYIFHSKNEWSDFTKTDFQNLSENLPHQLQETHEFDLKLNKPLDEIPWNRLFIEPTQKKFRILPDGFLMTRDIMNDLRYSLFKEEYGKTWSYKERKRSVKKGIDLPYLGCKDGVVINMNLMDKHYFLEERTQITKSFFKQKHIFENPDITEENYEQYQSKKYIKSKNIWVKETEERKFMMSGALMRSLFIALPKAIERINEIYLKAVSKITGISRDDLLKMKYNDFNELSKQYIQWISIDGIKYYSFPPEFYLTDADIENLRSKPFIITTNPNGSGVRPVDRGSIVTFAQGDDLIINRTVEDLKTEISFDTKNKLYEFYRFKDYSAIPKTYKIKEWSCRKQGKKIRQYCLTKC
jgi:hypothetical protein